MNNPFDYIEEFLAGELSETDAQTFEKAILENSSLREEVEMVKEMELFAQRKADNKDAIDVVNVVMEEGKRIEEGKRKGNALIKSVIAVVMLSLLTLASYVYFSQETKEINHEELFAEYFEPESASFSSKSNNTNQNQKYITADSILQLAEYSFNKNSFEQSIQLFNAYHELLDTLNPEAQYFKSVALLGNRQPVNAINNFNLINDEKDVFENDIHWYKGLSYLADQRFAQAREEIQNINKNSVRYKLGQNLIKQFSNLTSEQ